MPLNRIVAIGLGVLIGALLAVPPAAGGRSKRMSSITVTAPWTRPLKFRPASGWRTGSSGTYAGYVHGIVGSSAWTALDVRYRDRARADPPAKTLAHLRRTSVIVWAVIGNTGKGSKSIRLDFSKAKHFACCDAGLIAAGEYELTGSGRHHSYSVIVRVYFGSRRTRTMRAEAQQALNRLELPPPR